MHWVESYLCPANPLYGFARILERSCQLMRQQQHIFSSTWLIPGERLSRSLDLREYLARTSVGVVA